MDYQILSQLFRTQSPITRNYFENTSRKIALDLIAGKPRITFKLPDKLITEPYSHTWPRPRIIPEDARSIELGSRRFFGIKPSIKDELDKRLRKLEHSPEKSIALCAALFRFTIASTIIESILPAGNETIDTSVPGNILPDRSIRLNIPGSAYTQQDDAVYGATVNQENRGEFQVPFVPDAQRFFLPQWVAFDLNGKLIVKDLAEADANIRSMQKYFSTLNLASSIEPFMVSDFVYQRKRNGIITQLVNQGRSMANHINRQLIHKIQERVKAGTLNRGLELNLHYFDDQDLVMLYREIQVIPAGRILFIPAFIGRVVNLEIAKVWQDTRLGISTKLHLIEQFETLQKSFIASSER